MGLMLMGYGFNVNGLDVNAYDNISNDVQFLGLSNTIAQIVLRFKFIECECECVNTFT